MLFWVLGWIVAAVASTKPVLPCSALLPKNHDSVVVITHQVPPLHRATVRRFSEDEHLKGLPIVLVNDFPRDDVRGDFSGLLPSAFPMPERATIVRSSSATSPKGSSDRTPFILPEEPVACASPKRFSA